MRTYGASMIAAVVLCGATAHAEIANDKVKIGVLTDLSGIYEAGTGNGSVEAVKMAVEEFGGKINGKPIEILAGDHQNKPDVGASIANRWYDVDKVDVDRRSGQLRGGVRGARYRQAEEQDDSARRRRLGRFHRQGLRARQQRALGLRFLRTRRRDRRGGVATRQEMVLVQCRLRVRRAPWSKACGARSKRRARPSSAV